MSHFQQNNLNAGIVLSKQCNLRCSYCYIKDKDDPAIVSLEDAKLFIDHLPRDGRHLVLSLTGGEPFLFVDLMDDIIDYLRTKRKCFTVSICTNGTLFDYKIESFLNKHKKDVSLAVSIDGIKELHDKNRCNTYDKVIQNLAEFKKIISSIAVKATFTNKDISLYKNAVINLIGLGFKEIGANFAYEYGIGLSDGVDVALSLIDIADYLLSNDLEGKVDFIQLGNADYIREYNRKLYQGKADRNKNYCGGGEMLFLGPDRKIYGCHRFYTMDKDTSIGVLDDDGIKITNASLQKEILSQRDRLPEECKACQLIDECPSCLGMEYEYTDSIKEKRMCGWTHALSLAKFYMCCKLYRKEHPVPLGTVLQDGVVISSNG